MSVKATRHRKDTTAKEEHLLSKISESTDDIEDTAFLQVCKVSAFAEALQTAGWKTKIPPFEIGEPPLLRIRVTRKVKY